MHIAIVNKSTNKVENCAVPPKGAGAYFVAEGYEGVSTEIGAIGDIYDPATGQFNKPEPKPE